MEERLGRIRHRIIIDVKKCEKCTVCLLECKFGALTMKNGKPKTGWSKNCVYTFNCTQCVDACRQKAISFTHMEEPARPAVRAAH